MAVTQLLTAVTNVLTPPAPEWSRHIQRTGPSPLKKSTTTTSRLPFIPSPVRISLLLHQCLLPLLQLSNILPFLPLSRLLAPQIPSPSLRHQSHHVYGQGPRNLRNGKIAWVLAQNKKKSNQRRGRRQKRRMSRPRGPKLMSKTQKKQPQSELHHAVPLQALEKLSNKIQRPVRKRFLQLKQRILTPYRSYHKG